jgi:molybdopterin-guanine dinucleotide biosynthesis protein A
MKPTLPKLFGKPDESSTLLEYVLDSIWTVADELYVVFTSEPDLQLVEAISPFGVRIVIGRGETLTATLLGAIKSCKSDHVFLTREQYPFIKPSVALYMFEVAREFDASIPKWKNGKTDPFVSVYRRKSLLKQSTSGPTGADSAQEGFERMVNDLYGIRYISVETELKALDPDLSSFFTVNDELGAKEATVLAGKRSRTRGGI